MSATWPNRSPGEHPASLMCATGSSWKPDNRKLKGGYGMTICDLLVTVEETKSTPARIELAAWLAGKSGAHLTGLHAAPVSADALGPVGYDAGIGPVSYDSEQFAASRRAI